MAADRKSAEVRVDPAVLSDIRVSYLFGRLLDESLGGNERNAAVGQLLDVLFGGSDAAMEAMSAYAEEHGGRCEATGFLTWVFDSASDGTAKN